MNISFVLVEPAVPENVGAAARALKTMGLHDLRLVNPCHHLDERARWMAHGSLDVLEGAQVYNDLKTAVEGIELVIGTTARKRDIIVNYYPSTEILDIINRKKDTLSNLAVVFGRENSGLLNSETKYCDIFSTVAMQDSYPSLNLAQAVMVYAYCLSPLVLEPQEQQTSLHGPEEYERLKQKAQHLYRIIQSGSDSGLLGKLLERLGVLSDRDMRLLHAVCNLLSEKLE